MSVTKSILDDSKTIESVIPRKSDASSAPKLGVIDQYELLRELGGGGFGTVYLAHDVFSDTTVAVKGLPSEMRNNREEMENIRENYKLVSRLHHPNIASALGLHEAKQVAYYKSEVRQRLRVDSGDALLVMEYAPGVTLSRWRKSRPNQRVPVAVALEIVGQIAKALDYAHERKIIHRDIKASNVIVEELANGGVVARVLDFGLAAEVRSSMGRISREIRDTSGTRPYMAPEQWTGDKQTDATDQYSLAVMYCELVAGEVPFQSVFESGDPVLMQTTVSKLKPKLPEGIPSRQRGALMRALSKEPTKRFESCETMVKALAKDSALGVKSLAALLILSLAAAGGVYSLGQLKQAESLRSKHAVEDLRALEDARQAKILADRATREQQQRDAEAAARKAQEAADQAAKQKQLEEEANKKAAAERELNEKLRLEREALEQQQQEEAKRKAQEEADRAAKQKQLDEEAAKKAAEVEQQAKLRKQRDDEARLKQAELVRDKAMADAERQRLANLPPELRIVAKLNGREVKGAILYTMQGKHELPYKWTDRLRRNRSLGPYDVTYKQGFDYYHGTFNVTVDWTGERTVEVELKPGKLEERYKGTGSWF